MSVVAVEMIQLVKIKMTAVIIGLDKDTANILMLISCTQIAENLVKFAVAKIKIQIVISGQIKVTAHIHIFPIWKKIAKYHVENAKLLIDEILIISKSCLSVAINVFYF